ncbi:Acyl- N-acyltransferase [Pyrenophora seminiperda CCB06]|uniref:Acyl-N-acyltransferase n=1 Tax=Pyrenophora seminiperda CCB06 TaxID=1302712 RepID=A0A3M7M4Z6_9PLEO|nr:Acyl- N-acyltransferase [Pyrenophora seminiperda CCB06]
MIQPRETDAPRLAPFRSRAHRRRAQNLQRQQDSARLATTARYSCYRIVEKMPDPNLQISLLKLEEAEQYMRIRHQVFRPTVNKILYARGEPSQKTLDAVTEDIREGIINKGILYLKCVDTSTGEMIAGARWSYIKPAEEGAKERTWGEVDAGLRTPEPYAESDPEMFKSIFGMFNANKREILGKQSYYVLDTLVTLENHMRRGAGSMLVRWGCEKADEAHIRAYLEATPMGAPMYARHGFEPVKKIDLDLSKWEGKEKLTFIRQIG